MFLVPPEKPRLIDSRGEEIFSVIGPYKEGERLFLTCEVRGGK